MNARMTVDDAPFEDEPGLDPEGYDGPEGKKASGRPRKKPVMPGHVPSAPAAKPKPQEPSVAFVPDWQLNRNLLPMKPPGKR